MSVSQFPKSPNKFHPTEPGAVGSRNSIAQEGRDKIQEQLLIVNETADKVMNQVLTKLPEEVLVKLEVMGGIKEKLYNYINQTYVNMFNRYQVTMEDELVKKVRDFVDREEAKGLSRYTPKEITELIDKVGGSDKFNTGEIEKSIVNMYGHLQGHIQRGMNDLETETNAMLRQKTDVGAFIRGENAYSILKCMFKDNALRPKYVYDVKLSINILESELISPMYHYQVTVESLLKDSIQKHIQELIVRQIDQLKEDLVDQGKGEISGSEVMFEKIKRIENFTEDDKDDEKSKRYTILAKKFIDKVEGLRATIDLDDYDPLNIRENIKHIIDEENLRNRGYNTAINSLTSPIATFTRPSPSSGKDYAELSGSTWNMASPVGVTGVDCMTYSFAGGMLNLSTPIKACPNGGSADPKIFLNTPKPASPSLYRYLNFKIYADGSWQDVPDGMIVRLVWTIQGTGGPGSSCWLVSHDIPFDVGWNTYFIDLYDAFNSSVEERAGLCPANVTSWLNSGSIIGFRLDPNENIMNRTLNQKLAWVRLTDMERVARGSIFPISLTLNKPSSSIPTANFYYTTTRSAPTQHPANGNIVSVAPPGSSQRGAHNIFLPATASGSLPQVAQDLTFNWNTGGVAPGQYYLCVSMNDGLNTGTFCSDAPVVVE